MFLVEYKDKRVVRQIKSLGNQKALLINNSGSVMTETVDTHNIKVIAKIERIEITL